MPCSVSGSGDSCIQPEGGLGLSGVPRLKLMLTQLQQEAAAGEDDSASASYSRADYAAPEVRFCPVLCAQPYRHSGICDVCRLTQHQLV